MDNKMLTKKEISFIKTLDTPIKLQQFMDTLEYNNEIRVSIIDVLRKRKADCLEAAALASYILNQNGYKSFLLDLEAKDDDDHVICVFEKDGLYGAVAQSKYLGLKYKNPVYKSMRELSMSYFEHYFNYTGTFSLKKFSRKILLPKNIGEWFYDVNFIYSLEKRFQKISHTTIVNDNIKLPPVSSEAFKRETIMISKSAKVGKKYYQSLNSIKKI